MRMPLACMGRGILHADMLAHSWYRKTDQIMIYWCGADR